MRYVWRGGFQILDTSLELTRIIRRVGLCRSRELAALDYALLYGSLHRYAAIRNTHRGTRVLSPLPHALCRAT